MAKSAVAAAICLLGVTPGVAAAVTAPSTPPSVPPTTPVTTFPGTAGGPPSEIQLSNGSGLPQTVCYQGYLYSRPGGDAGPNVFDLSGGTCTGTAISGATRSAGSLYSPVFGGPNSLQFKALEGALDLRSVDVEGEARFTAQGDADTIGGAFTYFGGQGVDGERLDGQYLKQWRPFEGSRVRALIDVPVQVVDVGGSVGGSALLSGGFEAPVKTDWSLTGRAGLGGTGSARLYGEDGLLGTVSLASRWRVAQVGRGDLVIGDAVIYTGETTVGNQNVSFRNGIAYQYPLKQLVFGRQTSVRISYVNTYIVGDRVGASLYHELAVNFGVRLRQAGVSNRYEIIRVGVLYTNADHYNSGTLTVGFRF